MKQFLISLLIAAVATALSYGIGFAFGFIVVPDKIWMLFLEAFAVFTSYSCTYLCTKQTRWNYPIGVITTAAWSLLFFLQGMPALAIFNLYLVFSLVYGWFRWGPDKTTRPVTKVTKSELAFYALFGVLIAILSLYVGWLFAPFGTTFAASIAAASKIDLILAAMSGVAQLQLDNKKIENWYLWIVIDLISIPYFWISGMQATAIQFVAFTANAIWATFEWKKSVDVS